MIPQTPKPEPAPFFARTESGELEYAQVIERTERPLWWQTRGLSFTASGYGNRIPSATMVRLQGDKPARFRRVYVCICSNVGTAYVETKGRRLIVRD